GEDAGLWLQRGQDTSDPAAEREGKQDFEQEDGEERDRAGSEKPAGESPHENCHQRDREQAKPRREKGRHFLAPFGQNLETVAGRDLGPPEVKFFAEVKPGTKLGDSGL